MSLSLVIRLSSFFISSYECDLHTKSLPYRRKQRRRYIKHIALSVRHDYKEMIFLQQCNHIIWILVLCVSFFPTKPFSKWKRQRFRIICCCDGFLFRNRFVMNRIQWIISQEMQAFCILESKKAWTGNNDDKFL